MWQLTQDDAEDLKSPYPPFIHIYKGPANEFVSQLSRRADIKPLICNGNTVVDRGSLLTSISTPFGIPESYATNWDAFWDSITDRNIITDDSYLLLIKDAQSLLRVPDKDLSILFESLRDAAVLWALARVAKKSIALHVVLQVEGEEDFESLKETVFHYSGRLYVGTVNKVQNYY